MRLACRRGRIRETQAPAVTRDAISSRGEAFLREHATLQEFYGSFFWQSGGTVRR